MCSYLIRLSIPTQLLNTWNLYSATYTSWLYSSMYSKLVYSFTPVRCHPMLVFLLEKIILHQLKCVYHVDQNSLCNSMAGNDTIKS